MKIRNLLFAVAIILAACTPIQPVATPAGTPVAAAGVEQPLANTQWTLTALGAPGNETPVAAGSAVTLKFESADQAGGSGGCNSYGGTVQVQNHSLSFSRITSTEMACVDANVMQQEQQYFQALQSAGHFELSGDRLTIDYANGQGVLIFTAAAATTPTPAQSSAQVAPSPPSPATPAPQSGAGTLTPKAALERLFTSPTLDEAWFGEQFLAQVSVVQLQHILTQYEQQLGAYVRVEGEASPFTAVFAQGTTIVQITLDAQGRVTGLFLQPPTPAVSDLTAAVAAFQKLPGTASVVVIKNGAEAAALNADTPLAVGSTFKLAVLAALQDQMVAGTHRWDEVVRLKPESKSLPSGILQSWPDGSPLTLHTLATLMISLSDNTAADTLLNLAGRQAVEAYSTRNRPFLTTQEAIKLKAPQNAQWLARYRNGDEAEKRQVLAALAGVPLPKAADLPLTPTALDVEWYFTPRELCTLMAQVEQLDVMAVNPGSGVAYPENWARIAYKGGSETGVLNLTTWLQAKDGATYCVSATINRQDAAIDMAPVLGLYRALVGVLQ